MALRFVVHDGEVLGGCERLLMDKVRCEQNVEHCSSSAPWRRPWLTKPDAAGEPRVKAVKRPTSIDRSTISPIATRPAIPTIALIRRDLPTKLSFYDILPVLAGVSPKQKEEYGDVNGRPSRIQSRARMEMNAR